MPLFSIIVPVYNVEKYIDKCISSILEQSFKDFELILVDDGSPDNCPAICDSYAKKDSRVKVIHKQNGGASSARNKGLESANGKYILFIDSDDYWKDKNALAKLSIKTDAGYEIIMFGCTNLDISTGKMRVTKNGYDIYFLETHSKEEILHYLLSKKIIPGGPCIFAFSSKIVRKNNIYFKEGIAAEDYDFVLNIIFNCNSFSALNSPFYVYRKGRSDSVTASAFSKIIEGTIFTIEKWFEKAKEIQSDQLRADLLNYITFIYSTSLVSLGRMKNKDKKIFYSKLRKHKYILKYGYWKDVKIIKICVDLIGIANTARLLKIYFKIKQRSNAH